MVKFVFSHSKPRKQPFLLRFSKSKWSLAPPSDAHDDSVDYQICFSVVLARFAKI